jgi:hypothetical protein
MSSNWQGSMHLVQAPGGMPLLFSHTTQLMIRYSWRPKLTLFQLLHSFHFSHIDFRCIQTIGVDMGHWLNTYTRSRQARSKGRALLFLVSKQNLNSSFWCKGHTNNHWKWIKNEKVIDPQSKKGGWSRTQKEKPLNITKANSQRPKKFLVCYSVVVIRVKKMVCKTSRDVLTTL